MRNALLVLVVGIAGARVVVGCAMGAQTTINSSEHEVIVAPGTCTASRCWEQCAAVDGGAAFAAAPAY